MKDLLKNLLISGKKLAIGANVITTLMIGSGCATSDENKENNNTMVVDKVGLRDLYYNQYDNVFGGCMAEKDANKDKCEENIAGALRCFSEKCPGAFVNNGNGVLQFMPSETRYDSNTGMCECNGVADNLIRIDSQNSEKIDFCRQYISKYTRISKEVRQACDSGNDKSYIIFIDEKNDINTNMNKACNLICERLDTRTNHYVSDYNTIVNKQQCRCVKSSNQNIK